MTGETGAGKSILLGALSLILGQRADTAVLQDKSKKCVVEGTFNADGEILRSLLAENELEDEGELIIRREIAPNAKSRAFVNDTPVNLPLLKEIGLLLVDIHTQHENLNLSQQKYQLQVIDAYADLGKEMESYQAKYTEYKKHQREYNELLKEKEKRLERLDYIKFQFEELDKARLNEGEAEEAENEIEILQHAEDIKAALFSAWKGIDGDEINANSLLKDVYISLSKTGKIHKPSEELAERIQSCLVELRDIAAAADILAEKTEHDPVKLQQLEDRLNLINTLLQKHRVKSESELIILRNELSSEIEGLENMDFQLGDLQKKVQELEKKLFEIAGKLSQSRQKAADNFKIEIVRLLVELGIPNAGFVVKFEKSSDLTEYGLDEVVFMFSANKKSVLQELSKVASGGELSRLMLSIKSVISHSMGLPTIIFDEIDTGVSGEIAHRIGNLMKKMSADRQVLSVTHLPQVAACGKHHYFVYKEDTDKGTETRLKELKKDERVVEIAKMLSGEATTNAAMENARELLNF